MVKKLARGALLCVALITATLSYGFAAYTDIHGLMQNNIYTNSILNFSIKLPEDWTIVPAESENNLTLERRQMISRNENDVSILLSTVKDSTFFLFNVSSQPGKPENMGILAKAVKLTSGEQTNQNTHTQILEQIKFVLARFSRMKPDYISPVTRTKLGGLNFASMNIRLKFNDSVLNETMYATVRNGYILFFVSAHNNINDEMMIKKTFNTLLFY